MVIDYKLIWTKHIEYIICKAEKGLNILRCVTRRSWGADPKMAFMFYRAYIRSTLDYGAILYGTASNTNLKKVDRIQLCIGALESTTTDVLLAEVNEPPLELRRKLLARKFIGKLRMFKEFLSEIVQLTTLVLTNPLEAQ